MLKTIAFYVFVSRDERRIAIAEAKTQAKYAVKQHGLSASMHLWGRSKRTPRLTRVIMYRKAARMAAQLVTARLQDGGEGPAPGV